MTNLSNAGSIEIAQITKERTMTGQLKQLSEAATQGEWRIRTLENFGWNIVHYVNGDKFDLQRVSKCGNEPDANFIVALVNAYRAGELIPAEEARAREAVAYGVAAKVCTGDEDRPERISASALRKMSVSEQFAYEQVVLAWKDAVEILALTPDHTTTALEQIKQEARDEGKREFEADLKKVATVLRNRQPDKLPDALHIVNTILATLSEPKENSDE